ncbi:MAG: ABC transporter ATP-binding protein [Pusillimonas sp.]|jgi:branched-chain amino acid transport system ATP-binding protein|nr:ABC transporter ATP-binding protein [Pusillimonas sp.]
MSAADNLVLQVSNLTSQYGKVTALNEANIRVARGHIVTVIGGNGAGKSTLLNSLMGSLPTNGHSTGQVLYQDRNISGWQVEQRVAQGISLVPETRELFGSMSVEDNLLLGGFRLYRSGKTGWKERIDEVYEIFPRLKERRVQHAGTLSGGERQMLAVGRALMAQPELLMLDEPSLGLAPRIVREIFQIIARLRQTGVSILLVEQNARAALQVADYGYVLETGEVILEGPAKELSDNPRVIESYLGLGNKKAEEE